MIIVDESAISRRQLRAALHVTGEFNVVGEARTFAEAVALVERLRPATVLMHLGAPVQRGLEAIEQIMATRPTPIVVYSAEDGTTGRGNALEALSAGAIEVVAKPDTSSATRLDEYADQLRRLLRAAARIKVITHPRGRLRANGHGPGEAESLAASTAAAAPTANAPPTVTADHPGPAATAAVPTPAPASLAAAPPGQTTAARRASAATAAAKNSSVPAPAASTVAAAGAVATGATAAALDLVPRPIRLVAIGASTGGPQALAQVLGGLPADFAPAVLVVQHMADGFIPGLVSWLDSVCALPVVVAEPGRRLPAGVVSIAPSGANLLIRDGMRARSEPASKRQFHIPGIDEAFWSIAGIVGDEAVGVLLTGMGRDGAAGLKALRDKGAVTIGQDEATSAVYGMPGVAYNLGAVQHQLPLCEIAPAVVRLCQVAP